MSTHPVLRPFFLSLILLALGALAQAQEAPPEQAPAVAAAVSGAPTLVGTYPLPGEAFYRSIVFYFDQPLVEVADPSTLIQLQPPLAGTWVQRDNIVAFELQAGTNIAPGIYRASFQPTLTNASGKMPAPPAQPLLFANAILSMSRFGFGMTGPVSTNLQLDFTMPVRWEQLQQHLTITDKNGKPVEYNAPLRTPTTQFIAVVPSTSMPPFTAKLSEGLTDATGQFQTSSPITLKLDAPAPFKLGKFEWTRLDDSTDRLLVSVSHDMPSGSLLPHFQLFAGDSTEPITLDLGDSGDSRIVAFDFDRVSGQGNILRYEFKPPIKALSPLISQEAQAGTVTWQTENLRIESHYWRSRGVNPLRLQLYFSGTVSASALEKYLTVTPAVKDLKVEAGEYGSVDLLGEWAPEQAYTLQIAEGLSDQQEVQSVVSPFTWNVDSAPRQSGTGFAFEEPYYFPRRLAGPLTVYSRNVEKAEVTLYELFPSNLVKALDYMEVGKTSGSFGLELSRKIASRSIDFEKKPDVRVEAALPMDGFLPEGKKGIFGLTLTPGDDYYDTKIVVWTDIGVLAHWQDDQLLVYTHNLWNLAPLADAKVTVYSAKHQPMGEVTTGADGVARLQGWDQELGRPRVVIVETADDFTFLPLNERTDDPVAFNDTMPTFTATGYDAFLYPDRNLYRPGEMMHLRWLVRQADGTPLKDAPLKLRLVDSTENAKEFTSTLSTWGSGSLDLETARDWLTGAYTLELWVPGADMPLTTQKINIEDFVPSRIEVKVAAASPFWLPGEEHAVTVTGEQLSGGPARERRTSAAVIIDKVAWKPEQWPDYTFTNEAPYNGDVRDLGEATSDGLGNAGFSFTWQPGKEISFPVEGTLRGEVFEPGGRNVAGRTKAFLFPARDMLGMAVASGTKANTVDVSVAAVRPDGSPSALDSALVTLEKKQWSYYVRRYSSHNEANWNEGFVTVKTETVPLKGGKGSVTLAYNSDYGNYRVRVHRADSPQFASLSFWSYSGQARVVDGSRPSLIKLVPDKSTYTLGETANVRIESPFDGNAIVVIQGGAIDQAITVPIANGSGVLTLPLEAKHAPNVWLEATVIHPVEPGAPLTYPYASFAMLNVPVADPSKALSINFNSLPEEIRPASKLDVSLTVAGPDGLPVASEVTLALVDEGIHQILQYQNPDPVSWFQRSRKPTYRRAHYYDQVAYDFQASKIGGDELLRKRIDSTVGENWIKPLALWSGVVTTDATGTATISMDIPEFAGKVRLVAVATTGDRAGSQAANVTIRRQVILRTSLPRFVAPGDTFAVTVSLQNMMKGRATVSLTADASTPLIMAPFKRVVDLEGGEELVFTVPVAAGEATGSGKIGWNMDVINTEGAVVEQYATETALKVQSPSVYQVRSEMAVIPAGESRQFENTVFKDNGQLEATLTVTANPLARLRKALDYVVGYPYGCVEQTTSRCLPLFLLGQAAASTGNEMDAAQFQQFIQAGIDRLLSMQTRSGGLGYWPGSTEPSNYGSIYAGHFLALAKQDAAFQVPDEKFDALMRYLRERIPLAPNDGPMSLYNYAYACYVRALAKDATVMEAINSLDALPVPTAARQWLALGAITFTGAADQAQAYLLKNPSAPYMDREQGNSLNSGIRNDAITLMTQMAVGMEAKYVQPQAEKLLRFLEDNPYSTQEAAFVVTALSAYLKSNAGDLSTAHASFLTPDGTSEEKGDFRYKHKHEGPGAKYTVTNSGGTPLYVHFDTAGILVKPDVEAAANGITMKRSMDSKEGPADPAALKQGENYLLTVEITCDQAYENVILADLLPGGLEIENPRLDGGALAVWKKSDGIMPSFLEMRDDRLVAAFDRLERGTHKFYYAVRAVTSGTFQYPGGNAECMYEVKFNGRTAAGSVTIAP
jgi:uncharacterized protein YfaS (alpha-2-macroglobulin family)